jgi:hypothetical protein
MRFVEPDAGGAGDALEDQRRFLFVLAGRPLGTAHEVLLHVGMVEQAEIGQILRQRLARTFRQRVAVPVVIRQAVGDDGLRHRLATGAAHLAPLAADLDRKLRPAGIGRPQW